jgi:hypothetical protein
MCVQVVGRQVEDFKKEDNIFLCHCFYWIN